MIQDTYQNEAVIEGVVDSKVTMHHITHNEKVFTFMLRVPRTHEGVTDTIPVQVRESILKNRELPIDRKIRVIGSYRSLNFYSEEERKSKLSLYVWATVIEEIEEIDVVNSNSLRLEGNICKTPIYRTTPRGREITEIILAVKRPYGNTDYIPCIIWSANARIAKDLGISQHISLEGRIQSRNYIKKHDDKTITKTAYEVSCREMSIPSTELE